MDCELTPRLRSRVSELQTCAGNLELKFTLLGEAKRNGQFLSTEKEVVAHVDRNAYVSISGEQYASTIHCSKCHLLARHSLFRLHCIS